MYFTKTMKQCKLYESYFNYKCMECTFLFQYNQNVPLNKIYSTYSNNIKQSMNTPNNLRYTN